MTLEEDASNFDHPFVVCRFEVTPLNFLNSFMWSNDIEIVLHGEGLWYYIRRSGQRPPLIWKWNRTIEILI